MTVAEICEEAQVFPKLNLLTNHSRVALDVEIIMPLVNNLRPLSISVYVAKDNDILCDDEKQIIQRVRKSSHLHRLKRSNRGKGAKAEVKEGDKA